MNGNQESRATEVLERLESAGGDVDVHAIEAMVGAEVLDRTTIDKAAAAAAAAPAADGAAPTDQGKAGEGGADAGTTTDDGTKTTTTAKPAEGDAAAGVEDPSKTVVLTRDGKHTLPFEVVQNLRRDLTAEKERSRSLEAKSAEGQAALVRVRELEAQLEAAKANPTTVADEAQAGAGADGALTKEQIARLEKEYDPAIVETIKSLNDQIVALSRDVKAGRETREIDEETRAAQTVQDAIDAVPALALAQSQGGPKWAALQAFDVQIRNTDEWKGKSLQERFEYIAREFNLPTPTPGQGNGAGGGAPPKKDDITTVVDRALANAGTRGPATASDLPGGQAPTQSFDQKIENLDSVQLATLYEGMSEEQRALMLSRVI